MNMIINVLTIAVSQSRQRMQDLTQQEFHLSLKPHPRINNASAANSKTQCKNCEVSQRPQSCSKKVKTCSLEKDTNHNTIRQGKGQVVKDRLYTHSISVGLQPWLCSANGLLVLAQSLIDKSLCMAVNISGNDGASLH